MRTSIAALAVVAMAFISLPAHAACSDVSGTGEARDVLCSDSPLLLCIDGALTGDLAGTYRGAFQSLTLAPTLLTPLRFELEIASTITTATGTIFLQETGWLVLSDVLGATACLTGCILSPTSDTCLAECLMEYGRTEFRQEMDPYAGTGDYAAIESGWIDASGYGSYTTGISSIDYEGELCD